MPGVQWMGLAVVAVLIGSCQRDHGPDVAEVALTDCVTCHVVDYEQTANPVHVNAFPQTCFECHGTVAWAPSIFDHDRAVSMCVACHKPDYDGTADPVHAGTFPTTCDDCHQTSAWRPALEGAHPDGKFPISRGAHEGFDCFDCHSPDLGPSAGGRNADCVGCHTGEHSQARMAEKHREERDYNFDPANPGFCLECHPSGRN